MKRPVLAALTACAIAAGLLLGWPSFWFAVTTQDLLAFLALLALSALACVLGAMAFLDRAGVKTGRLHRAVMLVSLVLGPTSAFLLAGTTWKAVNVAELEERAVAFCDRLIPRLEAAREQTGSYPESIDPLLHDERDLPLLLRHEGWYRPGPSSYLLYVSTSLGPRYSGSTYDSRTGTWARHD